MTIIAAITLINLAIAASLFSSADAASIRGGDKLAPVLKGQRRRHLACADIDKSKNCGAPCEWNKGSCVDGTPAPTKAPSPSPTTAEPATADPTKNPTESPTRNPTEPPTNNPTESPTTCEEYCDNQEVNSAAVVDSASVCPTLSATVLATYEYQGDVLIELTGPSDMANALDLVISAPHGGDLTPAYIADRSEDDPTYCPDGCKVQADGNTLDIAEKLQEKMIANYCKVPFLVKNKLHRSKLDANREVLEAAHGNATAIEAWTAFHTFINYAQGNVSDHFGTTVANGITGINGMLFDVHGYSGKEWIPVDGSPLIQWGYRLSDDESLNPDQFCPIDNKSSGSMGTLTHGRWMDGQSYECLVRGPGSLGSRVSTLIDASNLPTDIGDATVCGHGTPSFEHPSPWHLATDATPVAQGGHCDRFAGGGAACHYFSGGFDVRVHERMQWEDTDGDGDHDNNLSGDHMNTVQAELPRCIRWAGSSGSQLREQVWEDFADILSQAFMGFLRDLYPPLP